MSSNEEAKVKRTPCRKWRIPLIVIAITLVRGGIAMVLWNALVPELFHGPVLTFPQTIGLLILVKVLVGLRPGAGRFGNPWMQWNEISSEERLKLREKLYSRCRSSQEP
ncbi:MAG: hypothetical protein AB7T49_11275 [Oligoflexales bacterium]